MDVVAGLLQLLAAFTDTASGQQVLVGLALLSFLLLLLVPKLSREECCRCPERFALIVVKLLQATAISMFARDSLDNSA